MNGYKFLDSESVGSLGVNAAGIGLECHNLDVICDVVSWYKSMYFNCCRNFNRTHISSNCFV